MIFDTHAHYDDEQFDADREALLSGMKAGGVGMIVDAAATVASWDKILELTEKYPFDFVIGSIHLIHGQDPYYRGFFEGRSDEEAYHEAFEVTVENLKKIDSFDSLGHLDYVVRYGAHQAEEYSYRKYAEEIDEILKHLISHGKGLEMNMAGMKYGLGFPNPHPDVIRRYKELGGEIVTIGADAHRPEHVAFDYEQAGEILAGCGFSYYAEFKGRKPVFRRIVP